MQRQRFKIMPEGNVIGGSLEYVLDTATGKVTYDLKAQYKVLFFTKEINNSGSSVIDPKSLASALAHPGARFDFGPLTVKVLTVQHKNANCSVTFTQGNIKADGHGVLDLSGPFAKIHSLRASGSALGFPVTLDLEEN